eukprot:15466123-Alexandrium_andersonii.AAC.1
MRSPGSLSQLSPEMGYPTAGESAPSRATPRVAPQKGDSPLGALICRAAVCDKLSEHQARRLQRAHRIRKGEVLSMMAP